MDLVHIIRNDIFTSSNVLAEGTGISHRKIKYAIRTHKNELEKLGRLSAPYRAESTGGRPEENYRLNEQQATFLITLLKNTETVVEFKLELVKQFYAMRKLLAQKQTEVYKNTRNYQKSIRKKETAVVKLYVSYALEQGSRNATRYYSNFSKLADNVAGIKDREKATLEQLTCLSLVENIIENCISDGINLKKPYKEIYLDCKSKLEQFQILLGQRKEEGKWRN